MLLAKCRLANADPLGFQEKLMLQNKAKEAVHNGLLKTGLSILQDKLYCMTCRFANAGPLGFQEKLMLQNKAKAAMEKGEKPPNEPGMQQAIKELKQNGGKTIGEKAKEQQE